MKRNGYNTGIERGFTIVELLIVIVVIGILAAIVIVAYSGIQDRARVAAAQSALVQASQKVASYAALNSDQYPSTLAGVGVTDSGDISYQYSVNNASNPRTYCITATHTTNSFWQNNTTQSSPAEGGCPGHGIDGTPPVTNLIANPNVEVSGTGYGQANTATWSRLPDSTLGGTYLIQVVLSSGGVVSSGASLNAGGNFTGLTSGTVYTISVDVYSSIARTLDLTVQGAGVAGSPTHSLTSFSAGQIRRITAIFSTNDWLSGSAVSAYLIRNDSNSGVIYLKNLALYEGDVDYGYKDGNSPNWVWNGIPNNSTSTGPAL